MRGAGSLLALLIAAIAAGGLIVSFKPDQSQTTTEKNDGVPSAEAYVEDILGLRFKTAPVLVPVSKETWRARVDANLSAQFGPGGLARRSRALDLLGFRAICTWRAIEIARKFDFRGVERKSWD